MAELLERLPNVRLLGRRAPVEVPDYLARFDVCLNLLRRSEQGNDVVPCRIYEYLSSGKPVVSMLFPEQVEHFPDVVYGAHSPEEFAALCRRALAETGELINIDGTGNRVASTLFGHRRVYFVVGVNKIAPDYDAALWRARNIASPKNAQRLGRKTPCAVKGDRCYNCSSPERICRGLTVLWEPMGGAEVTEVLLINQELGY